MKISIKRLRNYLDDLNYNIFYREISGDVNFLYNPFQTEGRMQIVLNRIPQKEKSILEFFMLGKKIEIETFIEFSDNELYLELIALDLIERINEATIQLKNLVLVAYSNNYVFVTKPYIYEEGKCGMSDVYIGQDSYRLSPLISKISKSRCLELCSGSGIQSILASYSFNEIDAVDINPLAVRISEINSVLNFRNNIKFYLGDLYGALEKNIKYDFIISNPPFIPFVEDLNIYPLAGDGGELGLTIIQEIIRGLDEYLDNEGKLVMIGEGMRSFDKIFLVDLLSKELSNGYDITLFLNSNLSIQKHLPIMANFCLNALKNCPKDIENKLDALYKKYNITNFFAFSLCITKKSHNMLTDIKIIKLYDEINVADIYYSNLNRIDVRIEKMPNMYEIKQNGQLVATIDEDVFHLLEKSSEFSLKSILEGGMQNKDMLAQNEIAEMIMTLNSSNIIKRR